MSDVRNAILRFWLRHPKMFYVILFLAALGLAVVCILVDVVFLVDSETRAWWYLDWWTWTFRSSVKYYLISFAAYHVANNIVAFGKYSWAQLWALRSVWMAESVLARLEASMTRAGECVVTWYTAAGPELWCARRSVGSAPDAGPRIVLEAWGWWEKVCGTSRAHCQVYNFEPTPPPSRTNTPVGIVIHDHAE